MLNPFDPIPHDGQPILLVVTCANWRSLMPVSDVVLHDTHAHGLLKFEALRLMRDSFGETTPRGSEDNWDFADISWEIDHKNLQHVCHCELVPNPRASLAQISAAFRLEPNLLGCQPWQAAKPVTREDRPVEDLKNPHRWAGSAVIP